MIVLAITVAVLFAYPTVKHAIGGVDGGAKDSPEAPSQALPGAPGPDNTSTSLPPTPAPSPKENNP